jgi:acetoacetyl-CoA synthetase
VQAPAVPRTLSGKKLEVPIKKILMGEPVERVVNLGSLANPEAMEFYVRFAAERSAGALEESTDDRPSTSEAPD